MRNGRLTTESWIQRLTAKLWFSGQTNQTNPDKKGFKSLRHYSKGAPAPFFVDIFRFLMENDEVCMGNSVFMDF